MTNKLCIYHAPCTDGTAAAWVVFNDTYWKDAKYFGAAYGQEPPWGLIIDADDIIFVDFSYKRDVMQTISRMTHLPKVTILDHHQTAVEELGNMVESGQLLGVLEEGDRSGAQIAWDWIHGVGTERPELLNEIGNYDTWKPSRDVGLMLAVRSYPIVPRDSSHEAWMELMERWDNMMSGAGLSQLRHEGNILLRYYREQVEAAKRAARPMAIGDYVVPCANCPPALASDVGHELAKEHYSTFAATWNQESTGKVTVHLRSGGAFDVSTIAKRCGGGGHPGAAGFTLEMEDARWIVFDTPRKQAIGADEEETE